MGKKVYVKHSSWKKVKQIGAQSNRLYRLQLDSPMALLGSDSSSGKELNELWHRRMGHLHHRALNMLRENVIGVREYFSSYKEEQIDFQITMGNIMKCTPVGRGTIGF